MTLVAICTKSGLSIDEHFGHASAFYVFEIDGAVAELKEVRFAERYCDCSRPKTEHHNENRLTRIWDKIKDCNMLFTMKIGETPRKWLESKGMTIIEINCPISELAEKIREVTP